MHDSIMFEVARQRIADQRRAADRDRRARTLRTALRAWRTPKDADPVTLPVIPDYAHELLAAAGETVPAPRQPAEPGRHARTGQ